jgi:GT2 family glycosyltransferase
MREISIGVVIVTFNSGSEAADCAETLLASAAAADVPLRVALVDNNSTDDTMVRL